MLMGVGIFLATFFAVTSAIYALMPGRLTEEGVNQQTGAAVAAGVASAALAVLIYAA